MNALTEVAVKEAIRLRQCDTGAAFIDARYAPLIVSCFVGDVDLAVGKWYEDNLAEVILGETAGGRRVVNVNDASRSIRTSPDMRKFWAEMSERNSEMMAERTLGNIIVVTNPLMRGVITAVSWLNPRVAKMQVLPSFERAVAEAVSRLSGAGYPVKLPRHGFRYAEEVGHLFAAPSAAR